MIAIATCTVAVLRGTATDAYNDLADTEAVVATGIPCSILERRRVVTTRDAARPQVVRWYTGRLGAGTDVADGDRLRNEQTGEVYMVDSLSNQAAVVHNGDVRVDLRRIT